MLLAKEEQLAHLIIRILKSRFNTFPEDAVQNRNAPFHEAFLKAFSNKLENKVSDIPYLISLSSWLHGLNTTLGQSFFEGAAHILSDGYKREFTTTGQTQLEWNESQQRIVNEHIFQLKNGVLQPTPTIHNQILIASKLSEPLIGAHNFTVDVFFEDDTVVHAVEVKTVKPNADIMHEAKQKILQAVAALTHLYPNKQIEYFLGFPFDPTSDSDVGYDKSRFLASIVNGRKYFAESEVLLAGEMWDYFSGEKRTIESMLRIINDIATPEFEGQYDFLNNPDNRTRDSRRYLEITRSWRLVSEAEFVQNDTIIRNHLTSNTDQRNYSKPPFNSKGEYDLSRQQYLLHLLKTIKS
jgi:Type II restriction endonuclease, TdeIII